MFAVHAGFAAALLGTLGPPSSRPALYISPGGAGNWSGDSWRNAGPLANLNTFISAASARGGEVWLRADAGTYTLPTSTQTLTRGGTVAAPVRIRGVDVNGLPMKARFVGARANPPTFTGGDNTEQIWLNAGASNLRFEQLDFRNAGTVFRLRQSNTNLAFEDITANNIRRLIQNNGTAANIVGFGIRRCNVLGYSKQAVIIRYDSAQGEIEDCEFDAGPNQDGDLWSTGIQLDDTAHDITLRRVKANNNIQNNGTGYWNGDGFSCERGNYRIVYVECSAKGNSDGAFDLKGQVTLIRCLADGNKRGFRMWGDALLIDCIARNPVRMGSGSVGLVYAYQHSRVRVQGGSYTITSALPTAPFHIFEAGFMAVDQAAQDAVVKPSSVRMFDTEGNADTLYATWDHADVVAPTIETITWRVPGVAAPYVVTPSPAGTSIEIAENQSQNLLFALSEPGNLSIAGPDVGKFSVSGRTIVMRAQDYDVVNGPGADGSKTLRITITVRDANDNASSIYPLAVTITDVDDDPISVAEIFNYPGADGCVFDIGNRIGLWADLAMTVPAQVGDLVAAVSGKDGFGRRMWQPDPERQAVLRSDGLYAYLDFDGLSTFYNLGDPGGFRFPQFTAFATIRRAVEDSDGPNMVVFFGRRSTTAATASNGTFWMGVRGGVSVTYRLTGPGGTSDGVGSTPNRTLMLSLRSTDGEFRSNGVQVIAPGGGSAANPYALTNEQPLVGARWDGTAYRGFIRMRLYALVIPNQACSDPIRFRIERQFAASGGQPL